MKHLLEEELFTLRHRHSREVGVFIKLLQGTIAIHNKYLHWDTIDQLINRLSILWSERRAGNTSPKIVNEIVSIIQEFREL